MHNIKVIIGASYGDEGKGLATDFFGAREEWREELINVLTNGGPQRGHTVELTDGRRHVFRHFGAASFRGAVSYYAPQFLVNPMEFFCADDLLFHFEEDFETMYRLCPMRTEEYLKSYRTVLFENAQGLLLDGNLRGQEETTTPSTTGIAGVFGTVENVFRGADVEICYVTRSYLTRHGDGIMESEMDAEEAQRFLPGVRADLTNRENRHQGALRFGVADAGRITDRIREDFTFCCGDTKNTYRPSVMVTHLNEYAGIDTDLMAGGFGRVYLSDGRTSGDVCVRTGQ